MSLGTDWKLTPYLYEHCHCIHCCEWASVILNLLVWLAASNGYGTWEWDPLIKGPSVAVLPCVCMVAIPFLYSILMISQDPHHDHGACLFQSLFLKGNTLSHCSCTHFYLWSFKCIPLNNSAQKKIGRMKTMRQVVDHRTEERVNVNALYML